MQVNWAFLVVSLLLPGLVGFVLLRAVPAVFSLRKPAVLLGYGYPTGIAATTLFMRAWDALGLMFHFPPMAVTLTALTAIAFLVGKTWEPAVSPDQRPASLRIGVGSLHQAAFWLFAALILVHLLGAGAEIVLRPLYPWDAWSAWGFKARVWFEQKAMSPIVDADVWLASADPGVYTNKAFGYPPMVSLIQTWTALALGSWVDTLINLPWLLCGAALGLGFYAQSRAVGSSPLTAMIFTYFALSLPLLNTHIALAGYADLWLASAFSLAGIAVLAWLRTQRTGQGILALILALMCTQIKLEGIVWALTLVPAGLLAMALGGRRSLRVALALATLLAFAGLLIALLEPTLLTDTSIAEKITATLQNESPPSGASIGQAVRNNLFLMGSWNLLWYLVAATIVLPLFCRSGHARLIGPAVLVVSTLAVPVYIFFFTGAFRWAIDYTALNRILLHLAPLYVFVIQLLWIQAQDSRNGIVLRDGHDLDSAGRHRYSLARSSR